MAKVYDALRRAEEQRRERAGQTAPEAAQAPLAWEPPARAPAAPPRAPGARGLFSGLRERISLRRFRAPEDTAAEINKRRIALLQPDSFVAEQFRTLRSRIDSLAADRPLRSIAITSPLAGEGKSTAAINLAIVTAMQIDARVCLVDCDLRKPKIHRSLGLSPRFGLAEVLSGEASLEDALIPVEGTSLSVLAVRHQPSNPSELLATARMRQLVRELGERFDRVILDTPAALSLPDAKIVSDLCDGIVMVVRADTTRRDDVEATLEFLDRRRLLGLVLNGARVPSGRYSYYPY
jgi:capsular exopolysaccharide synthesis family protein